MITRRSFLGSLSAVPSVAALHSMRGQASTLAASILNSPNTDGRPSHATFHSLAPGAVKPEGWLGQYLDKQAKGLSLHLPERSEEHTSELQSPMYLVCRLLLEKKKKKQQ